MADNIADVHSVPGHRIVAIEHPGIIRNFENGVKSLGGEAQLKHVLEHHVGDSKLSSKQDVLPEPVAGVSLRPNDPLAKKIPSVGVDTRNVLLKVTLPRRTGRKRKRGSDEPYVEPDGPEMQENSITAPNLVRRLRDGHDKYTITPVGMLRETHRFRLLPDFQLRSTELPIMRELRGHTLVPDYNRMKDFRVDLTPGNRGVTAFPGPPSFISQDIPYRYEYQQAASVVYIQDDAGNITSKNLSAPPRRFTWGLPPDVEEIPKRAPVSVPFRNPSGEMLPLAIRALKKILENRPLVTKRVALNAMPPCSESVFKDATQYVGYSFKAGPWRDSLIKYGVDPRKDPKFRFYQTMMFQVDQLAFKPESLAAGEDGGGTPDKKSSAPTSWSRTLRHTKADPTTHIFDGKNITANGKTWQVCDVTDPVLHKIFQTENIRKECDVHTWGWFHSGTMAKARVIMKDKMRYLFAGETPPEEDYVPVAELVPDEFPMKYFSTLGFIDKKVYGERASSLALNVRAVVKMGDGKRARPGNDEKDRDELLDDDEYADLREIDVGDQDGGAPGDFEDMERRVDAGADGPVEQENGEAEGGGEGET